MKNKYEINGDVTSIYINRRNEEPLMVLIDTEDLEKVNANPYTWYGEYNNHTKGYYIRSYHRTVNGKREKMLLHRVILEASDEMVVDHINHNTLDNRKQNLRICTCFVNIHNPKGLRSTNTSGASSVFWHHKSKSWKVKKVIRGRQIYLGTYKEKNEAENVANIAEEIIKALANKNLI
jgi:hypothetical protein